jgi:hypothetical protein
MYDTTCHRDMVGKVTSLRFPAARNSTDFHPIFQPSAMQTFVFRPLHPQISRQLFSRPVQSVGLRTSLASAAARRQSSTLTLSIPKAKTGPNFGRNNAWVKGATIFGVGLGVSTLQLSQPVYCEGTSPAYSYYVVASSLRVAISSTHEHPSNFDTSRPSYSAARVDRKPL